MTTYIALLRAVNLGPHNRVSMRDLVALCKPLGCANAQSILASGNLVFESEATAAEVEQRLATGVQKKLGVTTDFFVRSAKEWAAIVKANPFTKEAKSDPGHLIVFAFKDAPDLKNVSRERDVLHVVGRNGYAYYPDGAGRSKLTVGFIEKSLGTRGTGRNWNTTLKLDALAKSL